MHCGERIELKGFTECINDKSLKLAASVCIQKLALYLCTQIYNAHIAQVPVDGNTLWHLL